MKRNSTSYKLWMQYTALPENPEFESARNIVGATVLGDGPILDSAAAELERGLSGFLGRRIVVDRASTEGAQQERGTDGGANDEEGWRLVCGRAEDLQAKFAGALGTDLPDGEGFAIRSLAQFRTIVVASRSDRGVLYGVYALFRAILAGADLRNLQLRDQPKLDWRILNHWDNLDGSIERGYAGNSLWNWGDLPTIVDERYTDYARACASVGINGSVLNNVNTAPEILSPEYLAKVAAIAEVLRRWGIRTFLSVNFASPMRLGGLATADPTDQSVAAWWKAKADEIYDLIPDFGGFLVKADSEGQPGPYLYKRNHAEGANLLAEALEPHGGLLIWRAFVYGHGETDRHKKAYADFVPLDGKFRKNAAVQVKNGAIDFQPREPVHPMFGAMKQTQLFMEFQITQEYLGQGNHVVFLAPMWKEILDFDMRTGLPGPGAAAQKAADKTVASVGNILAAPVRPGSPTGIAAVTNTGDREDWCASPMHQANWYAFGRLAWDYSLETADIAREWIRGTFGVDGKITQTMLPILLQSWETCIDYMTPLGLHHIMREGHHYGPDPGYDGGHREDWRSTYYHRADSRGLGFDRSRTGTGATEQYAAELAEVFDDPERCPEGYLLWFHHIAWDRALPSGRTLAEELPYRYRRGVEGAEALRRQWTKLEGLVDRDRYEAVLAKFDIQVADAREWEEVCTSYFLKFASRQAD